MTAQLREGMTVVHLGGRSGGSSSNRGKLMRLEEKLGKVDGFSGVRWRVSRNDIKMQGGGFVDHANEEYLLPVR